MQAQAGFTVLPNYAFSDEPTMDAFLIPGGFGTRQEIRNRRLHEFIDANGDVILKPLYGMSIMAPRQHGNYLFAGGIGVNSSGGTSAWSSTSATASP